MDIIIKNGEIFDGSGSESYYADILISDSKIVKIKKGINVTGHNTKIIDASGLAISAGFIDMHSHSDSNIIKNKMCLEKLQQGVTSEVNGNCGFSLFPMPNNKKIIKEIVDELKSVEYLIEVDDIKWKNFNEFSQKFDCTFGTNQIPLVAHSLIRAKEIGLNNIKLKDEQIESMCNTLNSELKSGTWGMSTGLAYAPGCFADENELIKLCEVINDNKVVYITHSRDEGDGLLESINENIRLAQKIGCSIHISHLKAIGVKNHNKIDEVIEIINDARKNGINITADIYPYIASSTILSVLLPKESRNNGTETLIEKLNDKQYCDSIYDKVKYNIENRGGADKITINYAIYKYDFDIIGKSLKEISKKFNLSEVNTVFKLIKENRNIINAIYYAISEEGIRKLLKQDFVCIGSDGMLNLENVDASHPRTFGTFPKILSKYVREDGIITLEKAIYKMTKLPASIIGVKNRGEIKTNYYADIVIFDKNKIKDNSTFDKAFAYCTGIHYVIVNGGIAIEKGEVCENMYGRLIKR